MCDRKQRRKEGGAGRERDLEREEGTEGSNKASLENFVQVECSGGKSKEGNDVGNRVVST